MKHYIYVLKDPKTGDVRYVGQTTNTKSRLANHLYKAKHLKVIVSVGLNHFWIKD